MDYFSIGYNAVCLLLQSLLQTAFVGRFTGKTPKIWHFAVYLALLVILFGAAARLAWPDPLSIGVQLLALYGLNRLALGNRPAAAGAAALLAVYIAQLAFGLVDSVSAPLFPHFLGRPLLYLLVAAAVAVSFLICGGCYLAVLKLLSLEAGAPAPYCPGQQCAAVRLENGGDCLGLLLLPVLFCCASELYILNTAYTAGAADFAPAEPGKHLLLLLVQLAGLAALFCTLYAYRRIRRGFQAQAEMSALRQAARAQKAYIDEARLRYAQTRAFRHDIKNHLSVLAGLLQNGELAAGQAYLQKLDSAAAALSFPYQTGNPVVDILLAEKLGLAAAQGIKADVELVLPEPCAVEDFDWCVIFANALDNALNACRLIEGERLISITGSRQGDFYMLEFVNTCAPEAPAQDAPPAGVGLANIRTAAEKYHGAALAEKAGGQFALHVLLNTAP